MRTHNIKDMSLVELRQKLMTEKDENKITQIVELINYLKTENEKALESYKDSRVLHLVSKILYQEGKTKPKMRDGVEIGYEYDWGEAILKLHELFKKKEKIENKKGGLSDVN